VTLSEKAQAAFRHWGEDGRYGGCTVCGRVRGEDGRLLYVRRRRGSRWLCLDCWDQNQR
jgi:hypothetical protein